MRAATGSRPRLPTAAHAVFEARQLLDTDRPARVHSPGRDADFRAEAELAAIGELGRSVVQNDRGIDLGQKFLRGFRVGRHDRVGVARSIAFDMSIAPCTPSTTFAAMIASRYSVGQSCSVAALARESALRTASSPRTSQPASISMATRGLRYVAAAARSTSNVSAAPHTPVRRILALSTIDFAMSRSAALST